MGINNYNQLEDFNVQQIFFFLKFPESLQKRKEKKRKTKNYDSLVGGVVVALGAEVPVPWPDDDALYWALRVGKHEVTGVPGAKKG